jgi:hypothetical protein
VIMLVKVNLEPVWHTNALCMSPIFSGKGAFSYLIEIFDK